MSEFYYGHILDREVKHPVPCDEPLRHKCIVCGEEFSGTRMAKMCSTACKKQRAKVWRERWVRRNG